MYCYVLPLRQPRISATCKEQLLDYTIHHLMVVISGDSVLTTIKLAVVLINMLTDMKDCVSECIPMIIIDCLKDVCGK